MKEFFLSILAALGVANTPAPAVTDDTTTLQTGVEDNSNSSSDSTTPVSMPAPVLTREQAVAKAMDAVAGDGEALGRVELENEDGVLVWKVRLTMADGRGADVQVNAANGNTERLVVGGAVLVRNSDDDNDDDRRGRGDDDDDSVPAGTETEISRDEAIEKAKVEVSGDNESVERVELENEDGILVWKVRLIGENGERADIRVNAENGDIERLRIRTAENDNRGRGSEISSERRSDRAEFRARNGEDNSQSRIREEHREDRSEVRREDRRDDEEDNDDDSRGGESRGRGSDQNGD